MSLLLRTFRQFQYLNLHIVRAPRTYRRDIGTGIRVGVSFSQNRTRFVVEAMPGRETKITAVHRGIRHKVRETQNGGVTIEIPERVGALTVHGAGPKSIGIRGISRARLFRHQIAMSVRFAYAVWHARSHLRKWRRDGDAKSREALKAAIGLVRHGGASYLPDRLLAKQAGPEPAQNAQVAVVIPIYNGLTALEECLARVAKHTAPDVKIVLVEDASSDRDVLPFLHKWIAGQPAWRKAQITLLENSENTGFVAAVNRGLAHVLSLGQAHDVILLNSDAMVPVDWVRRLMAPMWANRSIGSVTPFSNDAELMTAPTICAPSNVTDHEAAAADRAAMRLSPDAAVGDVVVGVGFCMALSHLALRDLPQFDTNFGKGYGEEVDWCLKTAALGFRHAANGRLFVAHVGATSFTPAIKTKLLEQNSKILSRRHPKFDQAVQDFITHDPLIGPRLTLGLARVQARAPKPLAVFFAHSLGGGAQIDLERRLAHEIRGNGSAVVVRVGGITRWQIELHTRDGITQGKTNLTSVVREILSFLSRARIVYACGVGAPDPMELTDLILSSANVAGGHIEVLVHDYFMISPSYTLLNADGVYRGVPLACDRPAGHAFRTDTGRSIALGEWQEAWARVLRTANSITVFSNSSRDIVAAAYPSSAKSIRVTPHARPNPVPACPAPLRRPKGGPVIGVLGNLNTHKGALVIDRLARYLKRSGQGQVIVIGELAPDLHLPHIKSHGAYRVEDIPAIVQRYRIESWFMPSIWPETFSFTTSEMIETGLPVSGFNIGAQGQTISAYLARGGEGVLITPPRNARPSDAEIVRIADALTRLRSPKIYENAPAIAAQ